MCIRDRSLSLYEYVIGESSFTQATCLGEPEWKVRSWPALCFFHGMVPKPTIIYGGGSRQCSGTHSLGISRPVNATCPPLIFADSPARPHIAPAVCLV